LPNQFLSRYWKSHADGVENGFVSAGVVGEVVAIVASSVGKRPTKSHIENPSEDIDKLKKDGRTIKKQKNGVGWD